MTRCFVPTPLAVGAVVSLPPGAAAHLTRVLRLREGAEVTLFDGRGGEYGARLLAGGRGGLRAEVAAHRPIEREAPRRLLLLQALARGERMDWIVQKATELGAAVIAPLQSRRAVMHLSGAATARRREHWTAVAAAACEQCGRNRLPEIWPVSPLAEALARIDADALRLLLLPQAAPSLPALVASAAAAPPARAIVLLVGPEGGLAEEELAAAQQRGFAPCRLGPRILRTETAPVAALAAIQALAGDFA